MRGLAVFTLNSTYVFDNDDVMWIPNDVLRTEQHFGSVVMLSGIWYPLVLKPTEPVYDWSGITDIKPIAFSFKKRTLGFDDEIVSVVTSRVRNYVHLGEGETTAFRTEVDSYNVAKDTLLAALEAGTINTTIHTDNKPRFTRQGATTRLVMDALNISLSEARPLVKQVEEACLTVKVEVNREPLADWERDLINQY